MVAIRLTTVSLYGTNERAWDGALAGTAPPVRNAAAIPVPIYENLSIVFGLAQESVYASIRWTATFQHEISKRETKS
jgi:hypothetical protein